jgi:hypothetical protein
MSTIKLVKFLAKDSEVLFGKISMLQTETTFIKKNILPIAHTQNADEYVGLCFEDIVPDVCTIITQIEADKYYFFYSPKDGNYLTLDLVSKVLKDLRQIELDKLTITVDSMILDVNEDSQNRLSRALSVMNNTDNVMWKSFDNTFVSLTKIQIRQALLLAGFSQTQLWLKYTL